jgi:(1->4)-alpha-D-glucan 1-alpha-D-glucosylmutase
LNEAKTHTSWINPNAPYNKAVEEFVANALRPSPENIFLEDFRRFQAPIARAGMWNSISEVVLKIASPGLPDFYQGNELWNFVLVDPDNRQPVDYAVRKQMLCRLRAAGGGERAALVDRLVSNPCDGAIKLYVTSQALNFRGAHRDLFAHGSYAPLTLDGRRAHHAVAFARSLAGQTVIAIAGRFFLKFCESQGCPTAETWANTSVVLPKRVGRRTFQDVFTGLSVTSVPEDGKTVIPLGEAFRAGPFALLFSE